MEWLEKIIEKYDGKRNFLIQMLIDIQDERGYLPRDSLFYLSEKLSCPINEIMRIATFYKVFRLTPKAAHEIRVCLGSSCYIRGAKEIIRKLEEVLGIKIGETTQDMNFSLDVSSCSGRCGLGPEVVVDGKVYVRVRPEDVERIIEEIGRAEKNGKNRFLR